jgi:methylamine dehydrogenase accessory protein MauD
LRNGVLTAVAVFLVWQGWGGDVGPSAVGWVDDLSTVQLVGLIAGVIVLGLLIAQWWFLLNLMRQNGRLLVRLEALEVALASGDLSPSRNGSAVRAEMGLPVGSAAPDFELPDLSGGTLSLNSLRASGKPTLLLFTDPDCGPCQVLLPEVGRWQHERPEEIAVSLISRGEPEENRTQADEHGLSNVLLQEDWEVSEAYRVVGTPSAILVLPDGSVGSHLAVGAQEIETLMSRAAEGRLPR